MLDLAIQHIITVQQGETLGEIASQQGTSVTALAGENGISDPNLIYVGQQIRVGGHTATVQSPVKSYSGSEHQDTGSTAHSAPSGSYSGSSGGIDSVPGVPSSFVKCVAFRESTNGTNQAYNGGVYGIITASGHDVNGQSLSAQKQAFKEIYDSAGPKAWAADGCPGT